MQDSFKKNILYPILLFALLMIIYLINGHALPGGDSVSSRYIPLSLLCEHDYDLNEMPLRIIRPDGSITQPYFLVPAPRHRQMPTFGPGPGTMAFPIFYIAYLINPVFSYQRVLNLSKISASIFISISAVLLYFIFLQYVSKTQAFILSLLFGVATSAWSLLSQALWQHTAAMPWLIAGLLFFIKYKEQPLLSGLSGLFFGFSTICRPPVAILILPLTIYLLIYNKKAFLYFLLFASIPATLQLYYNLHYFGTPFAFGQTLLASYQAHHPELLKQWSCPTCTHWQTDIKSIIIGLLGQFFSPSRGLFVCTPITIFGLYGLIRSKDPMFRYFIASILLFALLFGMRVDWWGGWTYCNRFMSETLPLFFIGLAIAFPNITKNKTLKHLFYLTIIISISIQTLGAFSYDITSWNNNPDINSHQDRLWSITRSQPLFYITHPRIITKIPGYDTPPATIKVCPVELLK